MTLYQSDEHRKKLVRRARDFFNKNKGFQDRVVKILVLAGIISNKPEEEEKNV